MPVAKSYQSFDKLTEPYSVSGKQYIKVRNPKTGAERQVRWYSDREYASMYPNEPAPVKIFRTQRQVLGFEYGYITIFKGDTYDLRSWFKDHNGRYTRWWGWYIQSTDELPSEIPEGIVPIRLEWKDICAPDGENLKNEDAVVAHVETLLYDAGKSIYVGKVGDRIDLSITVTKVIELDGAYASKMYVMEDLEENVYVWTTSAATLNEGNSYNLRGSVKAHRVYRNTKQTVLTRCTIK